MLLAFGMLCAIPHARTAKPATGRQVTVKPHPPASIREQPKGLLPMMTTTRRMVTATLACLALSAAGHQASALTINGSGQVTDWNNIKPFSVINGTTVEPGLVAVRQNNTSPVNYSGSYAPSGGEKYDLEEMHVRNIGNQVQVLLVASSSWTIDNIYLGDLLINTDSDAQFDLGLVTRNHNGLAKGGLYEINTTLGLQNVSGSYYGNNTIETQIFNAPGQKAASFVGSGSLLGNYLINTASYSYGTLSGQNENNTYLYEFTFDVDPSVAAIDLQIDWGCGNDKIAAHYEMNRQSDTPVGAVPEPATAGLSMMSLAAAMLATLRRRR